jgi:putative transposase
MSPFSSRRPSAGVQWQDEGPTIVFLTVHTANRKGWLTSGDNHALLRAAWEDAAVWAVGNYVLMPDHLHLFCAPSGRGISIEGWIAYWKSRFSRRHGRPDWKWQSRGWHHRLRTAGSYAEKLHYVRNNPVRAGLVTAVEEWLWQGKMQDLVWRE